MDELQNQVLSNGTYDSVPITLTSNTTVVKFLDNLTLSMEADKKYWKDGTLTYTITLKNETDIAYNAPVITDTLDTSLVELVDGSVKIDDVVATGQFTMSGQVLTINLDEVGAQSTKTVKFSVKKKETTSSS